MKFHISGTKNISKNSNGFEPQGPKGEISRKSENFLNFFAANSRNGPLFPALFIVHPLFFRFQLLSPVSSNFFYTQNEAG